MPDKLKLYLDQMLNVRVADALRTAGHDEDHLIILSGKKVKWILTTLE